MAHKLVIVESPAKARTIGGYLGSGYVVESSIGHIRDLPNNAADTPARIKDKPWGRLAVDVDNGFEPYYVVPRDKKSHIAKLRALLKDADELFLATDEDREGEAIAWHLLDELKPKVPVKRMVFHEITKPAILAAADNPRELDMDLVEAQEARRILDRLYGYEVSPVLWRKVMSGLSAGRVQSVATRLVVDRERDRMAFRLASYWDLEGTFDAGAKHEQRMFPARLHSVDGSRVARGSDFGQDGALKASAAANGDRSRPGLAHLDQARAEALAAALRDTTYDVRSVESKPYRRSPYAPFRTTTLQQEASRKLGFTASSTMSVAQRLYENGFITYMRTDSTTLSDAAIGAARDQVRELYGAEYVPDSPRVYASKVANAQEAHEAIRPSGDTFRTPAQTRSDRRPVPALRADLDADGRLADEGRHRQHGLDPARGHRGHRRGRRVLRVRPHHHVPRLPQGVRRGHRRRGREQGRRGEPTAGPGRGRPGQLGLGDGQRPRDQAAVALHRGDADQGARGPEDRPPVDVRLDPGHHSGPGLRLQEGQRAGARLAGVLRRAPARGALHPADLLRVHRRHGGRPRRHRRGSSRPQHRAGRVLLRLRKRGGSQDAGQRAGRDRCQGAGDLPDRRRRQRDRPARGQVRPLPRGARRGRRPRPGRRPTFPTTCRPTN